MQDYKELLTQQSYRPVEVDDIARLEVESLVHTVKILGIWDYKQGQDYDYQVSAVVIDTGESLIKDIQLHQITKIPKH